MKTILTPFLLLFLGIASIPIQAQQSLVFGGLTHRGIGQATLTLTANNKLEVANLGSSGQDGVSVSLGEAGYVLTTLEVFDPFSLNTGANVQIVPTGNIAGNPDSALGSFSLTDSADYAIVDVDFGNLGATSYQVDVFIDTIGWQSFGRVPTSRIARINEALICDPIDPFWPNGPIIARFDLIEPADVYFYGLGNVQASGIQVTAIQATNPVDDLSGLRITGQNIPSFSIERQGLGLFKLPHYALPNTRFDAKNNALTVSPLDSTLAAGFRVEFEKAPRYHQALAPVALNRTGGYLKLSAEGNYDGTPHTDLGYAQLQEDNGDVFISADYKSLGIDSVAVEIVENGTLRRTATLPAGFIGQFQAINQGSPVLLTDCGKVPPPGPFPLPIPFPCIYLRFNQAFTFDLAGQPLSTTGDEIRILAKGLPAQLAYLSAFQVEFQGLGPIKITQELATSIDRTPLDPPTLAFSSFPNPVQDIVSVKLALDHSRLVRIDLMDQVGRKVTSLLGPTRVASGPHQWELDLGRIPAGLYFLHVQTENSSGTQKIIKK